MPTKTQKLKKALEYELGLIEVRMNEAFYDVLKTREYLNADAVYDEAIKRQLPPKEIARLLPALFKKFRKANLIAKTGKFTLSVRSSAPIPTYLSKRFEGKQAIRGGIE